MHADFWIMTFLMTVMALLFVLTPLARARQRRTSALLAFTLPAFATLAYVAIGSPGVTSATEYAASERPGMRNADRDGSAGVGSVSSLAAGLAARLEKNPDDGEGWLLLAKSYAYLQRPNEARHAYARATALGETDERVAQQVAGELAASSGGIAGTVNLSPSAEQLVQPDDTVFIFARPPGQAGAPVAVVRKTAETWPLEFRLTDTEPMADGARLSDLAQVIVTARISRRGDAGTPLKTLEAKSQPIEVASNARVHLTIE